MNLAHVTEEQIEVNPERVNEVATNLVDKEYDSRINSMETVSDAIKVSKDLFQELFERDADEHIEENAQPEQQERQEGDEQEGGEQQDGEEEGKSKARASDGEPEGEEDESEASADQDFLSHIQNKMSIPQREEAGEGSGNHIDYERYLESKCSFHEFDPCPINEVGVANFGADRYIGFGKGNKGNTSRIVSDRRADGHVRRWIEEPFAKYGTQVNSLANKIRRKLQVKSQARWVGGATSGRIHRKSAYRAAMPTVGDGRWNREIFKRRHQDNTLDVAVSVLCDFSGSMSGGKMAHATFGGYILGDAVGRVLRVPVQVQTFSEFNESTIICVLKNWNETVSEEEFKTRAARASGTMDQNDDGTAILWTYDDLIRRPEKRKVMIVLSDGSPASSRGGDEMAYTKKVVDDIESEGAVEMYGIGIKDRNVTHIYKEHDTINRADEIEEAILSTVQRKLIV
jgi:cobaltochelatase CobT